jgi:hypothetical protein
MRTFPKILTPLFALIAVAGCGGNVSGAVDRDAGPGPGDDANDTPPYDGSPVNPNCPAKSQVTEGDSCSLSGLVCPSSLAVLDCQGNAKSLACFCDGESWTCEQAAPPNCPAQTCPAPQSIYPGGYCLSAGLGNQCSSTNIPYTGCNGPVAQPATVSGECNCTSSGWSCPESVPPCLPPPPPTQGCPSPYGVYPYQPCDSGGEVCPGNPQNCDGETYYDAFECEGSWLPIATTTCNIGGVDASVGYPGIDGAVQYGLDGGPISNVGNDD